jgi:hypothetical protein
MSQVTDKQVHLAMSGLKVCQGRNSEVWQGTMGNVNVAIKMFASNHRQLFLNEKTREIIIVLSL